MNNSNDNSLQIISATKNITCDEHQKNIIIKVSLGIKGKETQILSASYSVNKIGEIIKTEPIKVCHKDLDLNLKDKLSSYVESEVTPLLLDKVQKVADLFEIADSESKRVFL